MGKRGKLGSIDGRAVGGLAEERTGDGGAPVGPTLMEGAHVGGPETVGVAAIDGLEESIIEGAPDVSCIGSTEGSWVGVDDNDSACRETGMCGFDAAHRGFGTLFSSNRSSSKLSPTAAAASAMYFLYIRSVGSCRGATNLPHMIAYELTT